MAGEPAAPPRPPGRRLRITVVRALPGLGDLLCAVPALRALAGNEVTYVGLAATRPLVARFGAYVDRFLAFPGWPGIPEAPVDPARIAAFLAAARRRPADLALQLHGSGVASAGFVRSLGAQRAAGYVPPGAPRPGAGWLEWVEAEPEALRPLRLLRHLGLPTAGEALELPLTPADERGAAALGLRRPYAIVHPGSALPDRRWPTERFAAVADGLEARGLEPVLTGTAREAGLVAAVGAAMRAPHRALAGRTTLGAFACAVRDAALVVCNDTGASHVAAAVGTPSVVVFRVTDPARWAPPDAARHRRVHGDAPAAAVLAQADRLLAGPAAPTSPAAR
jgi:ADP-heptose:LPS heptosyltransferase